MFKNIGKKIKTLAKVFCWLGIICFTIVGLIAMSSGYGEYGSSVIMGILIILVGFLVSWIGSFLLYGFGELIDSSQRTAEILEDAELRRADKNDDRI